LQPLGGSDSVAENGNVRKICFLILLARLCPAFMGSKRLSLARSFWDCGVDHQAGIYKVRPEYWGNHENALYSAKIIESSESFCGDSGAGGVLRHELCAFGSREGYSFDRD
jgi:hypothetical protein